MAVDNRRVFRNSIGGFNKQDVSKYIAELGRRVDAVVEERKKREEELARAREELEAAKAQNSELSSRLAELGEQCDTLRRMNEAMTEKSRTHFEDKVKAAKESDALYARIAELEGELPKLRAQAEKYERNAMHIADAMICAREESERIIKKAADAASGIREQLGLELDRVDGEARRIDREYQGLKEDALSCTEQLNGMLSSLSSELEAVCGKIASLKGAAGESAQSEQPA